MGTFAEAGIVLETNTPALRRNSLPVTFSVSHKYVRRAVRQRTRTGAVRLASPFVGELIASQMLTLYTTPVVLPVHGSFLLWAMRVVGRGAEDVPAAV